MIPSGTNVLTAKWTYSQSGLLAIAATIVSSGRLGGKTTEKDTPRPLEGVAEVNIPESDWKDGLMEVAIWAAKQRIGAQNYWMLNRWARWEEYTYRDVAADWAMEKAIRLTGKGAKKVVKKTSYRIYRGTEMVGDELKARRRWSRSPIRPGTIGAGAAGTTFILSGLLLPAFMIGIDTWGLNPTNPTPTVD